LLVDAAGDELHLRFRQIAHHRAGDLVVGPVICLEPLLLGQFIGLAMVDAGGRRR
jgi:hypothetical protein